MDTFVVGSEVVSRISGVDTFVVGSEVVSPISSVGDSVVIPEVISTSSVVDSEVSLFISIVKLSVDGSVVISDVRSATSVVDSVDLELTVCEVEDSGETVVILEVMVAVSVDTCEFVTNSGLVVS